VKIIDASSLVMLRTGLNRLRRAAGVALLAALAAAAPAASAQAPGEHSLSGNFLAGEHARAMSDHAAAANYLSAVLVKNPDNEDLLQATLLALVHEGRFAEALPIAQRLEKQGSVTDGVMLLLAMDRFKQGDNAAAIILIEKLSDNSLNKFAKPLILGWMNLANGTIDQARQALAPLAENKSVKLLHDVTVSLLNDVAGDKAAAGSYAVLAAKPVGLSFRTVELTMNFFLRKGDAKAVTKLLDDFNKTYPDNSLIGLLRPQLKQAATAVANERDGWRAYYSIAAGLLQDGAERRRAVHPAGSTSRPICRRRGCCAAICVAPIAMRMQWRPIAGSTRPRLFLECTAKACGRAGSGRPQRRALKILQDMTEERTDVQMRRWRWAICCGRRSASPDRPSPMTR
jgi:tetratricopeptide (TPR) repeat protein